MGLHNRIKLLIVDNEARVLNILTRSLDPRDFEVSLAGPDRPRELDLALVNPHASTLAPEELLRRLVEEHPRLEVVLLADQAPLDPPLADRWLVLHKPVETLALLRVLKEAYLRLIQRRHALSEAAVHALLDSAPGESSQSILRRLRALDLRLDRRRLQQLVIG